MLALIFHALLGICWFGAFYAIGISDKAESGSVGAGELVTLEIAAVLWFLTTAGIVVSALRRSDATVGGGFLGWPLGWAAAATLVAVIAS